MPSTLYQERFSSTDDQRDRNAPRGLKSRLGDQLDEIVVFGLVAVAVLYIAAASCWFIF
jgi:hypothetical protein